MNGHPAKVASRRVADRSDEVRTKFRDTGRIRQIRRENVMNQIGCIVGGNAEFCDGDLPQERRKVS
jgi:hypothetical protein